MYCTALKMREREREETNSKANILARQGKPQ
jgi:hypothetical protein